MHTPTYIVVDDLDSRREIWSLLHRLPPRQRVDFLRFACTQVPQNAKGHLPIPEVRGMQGTMDLAYRCDRANEVLTNTVYVDLLSLCNQWQLDAAKTAVALESLVKRLRL